MPSDRFAFSLTPYDLSTPVRQAHAFLSQAPYHQAYETQERVVFDIHFRAPLRGSNTRQRWFEAVSAYCHPMYQVRLFRSKREIPMPEPHLFHDYRALLTTQADFESFIRDLRPLHELLAIRMPLA